MKQVRLGAGSGFSGDRIEPAADLARDGALDYLVFECLAERTIALAQLARLADPEKGYDPLLEARFRAVLPLCAARKVRIVTNMGAANPQAAAAVVAKIAGELGLRGLRIATVTGDDVLEQIRASDCRLQETGASVGSMGNSIVSANAYLGAAPIAEALEAGADIVITGRVSDPALFLGPLIHEFGWRADDWEKLGRGVLAGHLLECAGQITGGYFADPGFKDVGDLARLGFPIGIVDADGGVTITKLEGSGGVVSAQTCKEQLLYEIDDPARYMQPDVVADFSQVTVEEAGRDVVRIAGAGGGAAPETLKVSVGYRDGYVGEGQISLRRSRRARARPARRRDRAGASRADRRADRGIAGRSDRRRFAARPRVAAAGGRTLRSAAARRRPRRIRRPGVARRPRSRACTRTGRRAAAA